MPDDGLDTLSQYDAVLLGAVGWPGVPDHVSLWGLLIPIRRTFGQYVNLRPVRTFEGITTPLADRDDRSIDLVIVRENNEGEYSEVGGLFHRGLPEETAIQEAVFTRKGITRIADHALGLAAGRRGHVTSATKSNGLVHSMPFWDEVVRERAVLRPEVDLVEEHVDALAAKLVLRPESFDGFAAGPGATHRGRRRNGIDRAGHGRRARRARDPLTTQFARPARRSVSRRSPPHRRRPAGGG